MAAVKRVYPPNEMILDGPGGRPTAQELTANTVCLQLAANHMDYLNLCASYENKQKSTMKAIALFKALMQLEGVQGEEGEDARDNATHFLDLYHPRRGEFLKKWVAGSIKGGYMDKPAPPKQPPDDPEVIAARAREARKRKLVELRKGPTFVSLNNFFAKNAKGPWPTHNAFTGQPFKQYTDSAAPAGGGCGSKRTAADVEASKAAMTSRLQALENQRKAEQAAKAAAEAVRKSVEWDAEEVSEKMQQELQSRFEKQQAAKKKTVLGFGEESEAVFLQQVMLASYQTNDAGDVHVEIQKDAPAKGLKRSCLRKGNAKMARHSVFFEADDED